MTTAAAETWQRGRPLAGRVAIVTGAGKGVGRAVAELFAECGASVVVSDVDEASGEVVVAGIQARHGAGTFMPCNVADEAQVEALVARTVEMFGRVDCAVNNAAVAPDSHRLVDAMAAEVDRIFAVNLRSVVFCLKHQIAAMSGRQGSTIVNVASISGVRPQISSGAYSAAKAGVISLTKTAAVEAALLGVRVNAVVPGVLDTPMNRSRMAERGIDPDDHAKRLSLFERLGEPREVAEACLWLCSPASSFVTGHALAVDAGYLGR